MSTAAPQPTAPAGTPPAVRLAYARAHERAARATWIDGDGKGHTGLVAYRTGARNVFAVPSASRPGALHTVTRTGNRLTDLQCSCAGGNHPSCMHRAVVAHGLVHGCWAKRPAPALPESTPAEIAATEALLAETRVSYLQLVQTAVACRICGGRFLAAAGTAYCPDCLARRDGRLARFGAGDPLAEAYS